MAKDDRTLVCDLPLPSKRIRVYESCEVLAGTTFECFRVYWDDSLAGLAQIVSYCGEYEFVSCNLWGDQRSFTAIDKTTRYLSNNSWHVVQFELTQLINKVAVSCALAE